MNAQIIPFIPRRGRKRGVIDFSSPASPPDDLVMDHVDTAPCEIFRHCEERSDEAIHPSIVASRIMDCFASLAMTAGEI